MNPKNLVTAALLLFVAAGVVVLVVKGLQEKPEAGASAGSAAGQSGQANDPSDQKPLTDGVIAYYFHGNTRCDNCQTIEAFAKQAIESGFADQLRSGKIRWLTVNYEKSGNERLATEYGVIAPTLVLVGMKEGKQRDFKNLDRVWELIGDKAAFLDYVQQEVHAFLAAASA